MAEGAAKPEADAGEATGQGHQFAGLAAAVAIVKPELEAAPGAISAIHPAVGVAVESPKGLEAAGSGAAAVAAAEVFRQQFADRANQTIAIAVHHKECVLATALGAEPGGGEGQAKAEHVEAHRAGLEVG